MSFIKHKKICVKIYIEKLLKIPGMLLIFTQSLSVENDLANWGIWSPYGNRRRSTNTWKDVPDGTRKEDTVK